MVRHYVPTGRPRGRPKKITTPLIPKIGTPSIPKIDPKNVGEEPLKELGVSTTTTTTPVIVSHQPQTPQQQQTTTAADYKAAILDRDKGLERMLKEALGVCDARVRPRLLKLLSLTSEGVPWKEASAKSGVSWPQLSAYRLHYPTIHELWKAAKESGEELRQIQREEEADRRGVLGWDEPVFDLRNGKVIGSVRRFSDRCLELKLKAADPQKYGEKHQLDIKRDAPAVVVYRIEGVTLGQQPPPTDWSKGAIPAEDVTKALPEKPEEPKPQ